MDSKGTVLLQLAALVVLAAVMPGCKEKDELKGFSANCVVDVLVGLSTSTCTKTTCISADTRELADLAAPEECVNECQDDNKDLPDSSFIYKRHNLTARSCDIDPPDDGDDSDDACPCGSVGCPDCPCTITSDTDCCNDPGFTCSRSTTNSSADFDAAFSGEIETDFVELEIDNCTADLEPAGGIRFSLDECDENHCILSLDDLGLRLPEDTELCRRPVFNATVRQARPARTPNFDRATGRFSFEPMSVAIYADWRRGRRIGDSVVDGSTTFHNDEPVEGLLDLSASPPKIVLLGEFRDPDGSLTLELTGKVTNQPPAAVLRVPEEVECQVVNPEDSGTFVDLDASESSDPDGGEDITFYQWTVNDRTRTVDSDSISEFLGLGEHEVSVEVFDRRLASSQIVRKRLRVRDTSPPVGTITSPAECQCLGPSELPVEIVDDFHDLCRSPLRRTLLPGPGPFDTHGDQSVALTVRDSFGNAARIDRNFTIDLVSPQIGIRSPLARVYSDPAELPIAIELLSIDHDGALGGVAHEQILLDGEVLFDGMTLGDRDGRLSDEVSASGLRLLAIGPDELCASAAGLNGPHDLTVVSQDCGGNVETLSVPFSVSMPALDCAAAVPRSLVINELDYDQGPHDAEEFVEIKNVGSDPVSLAGYALRTYYYGPFETQPRFVRYARYPMDDVELAPGDYFVVCTEENPNERCDQRVAPTGWGFDPPELLRETSPGAVTLVFSESGFEPLDRVVDSVCYVGSETPGDPGLGIPGRLAGSPLTEDLCNSQIEIHPDSGISRVPDGRDRDSNLADLRHTCITPGEPNAASTANCETGGEEIGRLVVNELDVNQPQHPDPAEFVEILNTGGSSVHLGDYLIVHRFLDQARSFLPVETRLRLPDHVLSAGSFFVVCRDELEGSPCDGDRLFELHEPSGVVAIVHNATDRPELDILVDSVAYGSPNDALEGGPSGGGLWIEGLPIGSSDGATAVDELEGTGFSRACSGADTDSNSSDFRLAPVTPGRPNSR